MELPPEVVSAMNAMKAIGLSWEDTKPVLKNLLKVYDHNWALIESENYRVLADAVLDSLESRDGVLKKKRKYCDDDDDVDKKDGAEHDSYSGKKAKPSQDTPFVKVLSLQSPKNEHKRKALTTFSNRFLGPEAPLLNEPIATTSSPKPLATTIVGPHRLPNHCNSSQGISHSRQIVSAHNVGTTKGKEINLHDCHQNAPTNDHRSVQYSPSAKIELASTTGIVRLMVQCNPALPYANFQMPSIAALCKMVEDKCLKLSKNLEPRFSLLSLLNEMCHCVIDLCSKSSTHQGNIDLVEGLSSGFSYGQSNYMNMKTDSHNQSKIGKDTDDTRGAEAVANDSLSLVVIQPQRSGGSRTVSDVDICRGQENLQISLESPHNVERRPPSFYYIPRNIVYQNAYVNISLARIGDEDCCSACSGDCLTASIPCQCARETGGDYAYTSDGLMKKEFLDAIISMKRGQLQKHLYYCEDCPIERVRNEVMPDSCKGHLIRKFVKECWSKCGCNRICGNRLVQRGITRSLQVFYTAESKGWGLRTLDELPKGAFICEYVGEILTNTELYDRQLHVTGKMRHTYPVLLDADWGSEQVLKDEEALCLDGTFYGNVARFINHRFTTSRCVDANIVEVPVEIETPDHHYYHLAFFTAREVAAFEELTWDYGIDFDDKTHPIKAFSCRCRSKFCRDRRQTRKKPALVLG